MALRRSTRSAIAEEGAGADDGDRGVERLVVDQDGAEHRPLGVEIVRQRALGGGDSGFRGHGGRDARSELYVSRQASARLDGVEKTWPGAESAPGLSDTAWGSSR
jgi:hypothetical protein